MKNLKNANELLRDGFYLEALKLYEEIKREKPWLSKLINFNINLCHKYLSENHECNIKDETEMANNRQVFIGIASIRIRMHALKETIESLIDQTDKIGVYLDDYDHTPEFLKNPKILVVHSSEINNDLGDAGKFFWVENHNGYYFTCDDDLRYPPDFVQRTIDCIENSKKPIVVGWHGSIINESFKSYYYKESRKVLTFGSLRERNANVHILGTGCMGFHTRHINVNLKNFKTPNMADVYFALLGQNQRIPFFVIKHQKGEITEIEQTQAISIFKHSSSAINGSRQNTKEIQNELVSKHNWRLYRPDESLKITIIGRYNINKRGGINKSSNLLSKHLKDLGHTVDEICISDKEKLESLQNRYTDFILAYAPDPNRPDFGQLLDIIKSQANAGVICAVNFSINGDLQRSRWIKEQVIAINSTYEMPRVFIAAFTNSTNLIDEELKSVEKYIVTLPKTLDPGPYLAKSFEERKGVFIGDLAKLTNNNLVHGNAKKWIEQIRVNLPHAEIYGLKHYHTDKIILDYLKIIPYNAQGLASILSSVRLCVCLTPGATFEMIPVEAAMLGTPVIHRAMPQSLSEYLSPVSTEVSSPTELGEICVQLYEREDLWNRVSKSSSSLYSALHIDNLSASIELGIRKCLHRSKSA